MYYLLTYHIKIKKFKSDKKKYTKDNYLEFLKILDDIINQCIELCDILIDLEKHISNITLKKVYNFFYSNIFSVFILDPEKISDLITIDKSIRNIYHILFNFIIEFSEFLEDKAYNMNTKQSIQIDYFLQGFKAIRKKYKTIVKKLELRMLKQKK